MVAQSRAEAKLRLLAHGVCEVIWLKLSIEGLQVNLKFLFKVYSVVIIKMLLHSYE